jgi:leucyl aminopeptidase (aminopeptidase T)
MPKDLSRLLTELSRDDLERLLAAKSEVEELETRRDELRRDLAEVERQLARLADTVPGRGGAGRRKKSPKKVARKAASKKAKKTTRKKKAGKKTTRTTSEAAGKKAAKKAGKKAGKKTAKKTGKKVAKAPRNQPTLEDVIVQVLQEHGEPMAFKDILGTITGRKLFKTRSKSFDNVLRRTISTSDRIKRHGRGIYTV